MLPFTHFLEKNFTWNALIGENLRLDSSKKTEVKRSKVVFLDDAEMQA